MQLIHEDSMRFIRAPLDCYRGFKYVPWEEIFSDFQGTASEEEAISLAEMIIGSGGCDILDLSVGNGGELLAVIRALEKHGYSDKRFVGMAKDGQAHLATRTLSSAILPVSLEQVSWQELASGNHKLHRKFDFAFLTGNCLTHSWLGDESNTTGFLHDIVRGFQSTLRPGGRLFIDSRNFDFILSLKVFSASARAEIFRSMPSVRYHGLCRIRFAFPAYISGSLVVFHYYDTEREIWSVNDFFPVTHRVMLEVLSRLFEVERIFWDYSDCYNGRSHFIQYLARSLPGSGIAC